MRGAVLIVIATIIMSVLYFVLGSVVEAGYVRVNLDLADGGAPLFDRLFSCFPYWKTTALTRLFILLWSLLLVIPGIMAPYSYAMTGYILAEQPELTAEEAIAASKEMMSGNC